VEADGTNPKSTLSSAKFTVPLGRASGVLLALHWSFPLFALLEFVRGSQYGDALGWVGKALVLWFIGVGIHQFGQYLASRRAGVPCERVVLWPFGGLEPPPAGRGHREKLTIALGGPLSCLTLVVLISPWVIATDQVNSFFFRARMSQESLDLLATFWGINLDLLLLSLIPALPFSGGRALDGYLSSSLTEDAALARVTFIGRIVAVVLFAVGLFASENCGALILVAFIALFGGEWERKRRRAESAAEESWRSSAEVPPEGVFGHWLRRRRELAESRRRETRARERVAEETRLDELLKKIHRVGRESLTRQERRFLERMGNRLRDRESGTSDSGNRPD